MAKIAILGFGTVGSGVYEVLCHFLSQFILGAPIQRCTVHIVDGINDAVAVGGEIGRAHV